MFGECLAKWEQNVWFLLMSLTLYFSTAITALLYLSAAVPGENLNF